MDIINNEFSEEIEGITTVHIVNQQGGGSGDDDRGVNDPDDGDDDTAPDPKPFPDEPRSQSGAGGIEIYTLLVGINTYHEGVTGLNNLTGCRLDVNRMEDYLIQKYAPGATPISYIPNEEVSNDGRFGQIDDLPEIGPSDELPTATHGNRLHVCVLMDHQATYENIIRAFEEHLNKATGHDSVLFHFSGHGSEQFTAEEFVQKRLDANGLRTVPPLVASGKDQCMVVYRPTTPEGESERPMFLADKELAALIHKVKNNPRTKEGDETSAELKPHIVLSLDMCHSGGGSRGDAEVSSRAFTSMPPNVQRGGGSGEFEGTKVRKLEDYYGDYHLMSELKVPETNHVILTAAQSFQKAWDSLGGGVYTISLIEILNNALNPGEGKEPIDLHYADLYNQMIAVATRNQIDLNIETPQSPQFDALGGFDPYTCFLEGWTHPAGSPHLFPLFVDNENWFVKAGAVHGIPTISNDSAGAENNINKVKVKIYTSDNIQQVIAHAYLSDVGAQTSKLDMLPDQITLEPGGHYLAKILTLPAAPIFILMEAGEGAEEELQILRDNPRWSSLANKNIFTVTEGSPEPRIEISINSQGDFALRDLYSQFEFSSYKKIIGAQESTTETLINKILNDLENAVDFVRLTLLERTDSPIRPFFEVELVVMEGDPEAPNYQETRYVEQGRPASEGVISLDQSIHLDQDRHKLDFMGSNYVGGRGFLYNFDIKVSHTDQDLYFYAFMMMGNGSVQFFNGSKEEGHFRHEGSITEYRLKAHPNGLMGLGPNDNWSTFWLKVIATTEVLSPELFERDALNGESRLFGDVNATQEPIQFSNEWAVATFELNLVNNGVAEEQLSAPYAHREEEEQVPVDPPVVVTDEGGTEEPVEQQDPVEPPPPPPPHPHTGPTIDEGEDPIDPVDPPPPPPPESIRPEDMTEEERERLREEIKAQRREDRRNNRMNRP